MLSYNKGVAWEINYTDEFGNWWDNLTVEEQVAVEKRVDLLAITGPTLGRPAVDRIHTSRHSNMKELRVGTSAAIRVLFAFDPNREAVLLIGGDKAGAWNAWYEVNVPLADDLFDNYLIEPKQGSPDDQGKDRRGRT